MTRGNFDIYYSNIQQELEDYRREIAIKKSKYQEKSKELIAVNTQFQLKHSLKLLESEAAYLLTLEIGIPIDLVAIQCSVEIVSLDIDKYFGLQTQHKNMEFDKRQSKQNEILIHDESIESNHCFAFHASDENITRFTWKFRVCEGEQGQLKAFVASKRLSEKFLSCLMSPHFVLG